MNTEEAITANEEQEKREALLAHVVPFAAWLVLMQVLPATAWAYSLRSVVCLGLFAWYRPWRWYDLPAVRHIPVGLAVGALVFVIWVLPESAWMGQWPSIQNLYLKIGTMPPWKVLEPLAISPYAPEICGWPLVIARLAGSALVITVIEEVFWRGFLYRWLIARDFRQQSLAKLDWVILLTVSALFGLEHTRWLVGVAAGLAYGLLAVKTGNLWSAVVAHVTTNLLLGIYVLATASYAFW